MTPYYERNGITIYQGDCRDILPTLPVSALVVTDPPYNIGFQAYDVHRDIMPDDEYIGMLAGLQRFRGAVVIQYPEETMRLVAPALGVPLGNPDHDDQRSPRNLQPGHRE